MHWIQVQQVTHYTVFQQKNVTLVIFNKWYISTNFYKIQHATSCGNMLRIISILSTSLYNYNYITFWIHILAVYNNMMTSEMSWFNMCNAVMKHVTSNVRATVWNELLVHELRHRVSFATGQLLHLLRSSTSTMDLPCLWCMLKTHTSITPQMW